MRRALSLWERDRVRGGVEALNMDLVYGRRDCSPSPQPSPLGRGRIARRAFANPERVDSSQRGVWCSLSRRERARVRGKETPPTKTAGRILQAQLDLLP